MYLCMYVCMREGSALNMRAMASQKASVLTQLHLEESSWMRMSMYMRQSPSWVGHKPAQQLVVYIHTYIHTYNSRYVVKRKQKTISQYIYIHTYIQSYITKQKQQTIVIHTYIHTCIYRVPVVGSYRNRRASGQVRLWAPPCETSCSCDCTPSTACLFTMYVYFNKEWMYVCIYMYRCMYVYIYVCMYVCMKYEYIYMYVCMNVCMYVYIYMYLHVCIYVYIYVCM